MTQISACLLNRARTGDERAWAELVNQCSGQLRAIAYGFRLTREQAADAAQTTWMRLVGDFDKIRDLEKLGGWLSTVMRRECIRVVNRQRCEVLTDDWTGKRFGHNPSADVAVLLVERNTVLWSAVERLPSRERAVVLALGADPPASYAEISAELSMPIGAIGPTRRRALRRLRGLLVAAGIDEDASTSTVERTAEPAPVGRPRRADA
jgi:RNA polymerase sigma factor (sigma-70 family)